MPTLIQTNSNTTATTYTAATEVAAITSIDPVNTLDAIGAGITISGLIVFTSGGTAGAVTLKIRQGVGVAGPTVASITLPPTLVSTLYAAPFTAVDVAPAITGPGNSGVPIYTVTLTVAGSNGTGAYAAVSVITNSGEN
jgi:hypothetical protein